MHKHFLMKVEEYVRFILETRTPSQNGYHNLAHTKDVVESCVEIGIGEKVSPDDLEMIQIAAWFHDLGYIEKTEGHEELSAMFASNFLTEEHFPNDRIETVICCILSTRVPQNPMNNLEKIICDADLSHFGRKTFFEWNNKFRVEYEHYSHRRLTEYEWITKTIDFVTRHNFFTDYALQNFSTQKKENLRQLQLQLEHVLDQTK